ncbi:MAG: class I SAM-dependent methyltransferase [Sphingobium limneticum]
MTVAVDAGQGDIAAGGTDVSYAQYDAWKGWDAAGFMTLEDPLRVYYECEFADLPVRGEKVLEIGFGHGSLLAWLQKSGADVYGTELSGRGQALARERGIKVVSTDLDDTSHLAGKFGLIVAFDVLEHLSYDELRALFAKSATLLRDGGSFVARFPNGASPFARPLQHGDITHITTLTASKIEQLLLGVPLRIVRASDPIPHFHGGVAKRLAKRTRNLARKGFECVIRSLYGITEPLNPNLMIVLRK